jgi:hypothetical protein
VQLELVHVLPVLVELSPPRIAELSLVSTGCCHASRSRSRAVLIIILSLVIVVTIVIIVIIVVVIAPR